MFDTRPVGQSWIRRPNLIRLTVIQLCFSGALLWGQDSDQTLRVLQIQEPIEVDGVLDEQVWKDAPSISRFMQREPDVGEPATERTEVRILRGPTALYIGVICFDSDPTGIIARERRRDNNLTNDDRFELVLDTFHDRRNAFYFVTNPLGTRFDALVTDEVREVNKEWDESWWVEAKVTETGWALEFEVPLSILRAPKDLDIWGVNFLRFIRRKNEISLWTGWSRDFSLIQVSQAGRLLGMQGIETGLRARIKPYLLGGIQRSASNQSYQNASEVGIEVAKIGITPSLVSEFTLNPDFAQADVDEAVVNLTRFPLFFPEKREFFLEGAGNFNFSRGEARGVGTRRMLQMFFSRRIGLTEDRQPLPVIGGAKVTGRTGGLDVGFLNVQTEEFEGRPADNYAVFRLKKNILARSNFGGFFSNRQASQGGDYNRVAGAEANFTFFKNVDIHGFLGRSLTKGVEGDDTVSRAKFDWFSERFEVFAEHLYIGEDFQHDIGFVRRRGIRRSNGIVTWDPRPDIFDIRRVAIKAEVAYLTDTDNRLLSRFQYFHLRPHFHSGAAWTLFFTDNFERLDEPFRISEDIAIPQGDYNFFDGTLQVGSSPQNRFAWSARAGFGGFFSGRREFVSFSPTFRPTSEFSSELSYEYNNIRLPQGNFHTHVLNSRFNVNLTNRWLTTAFVQYDTERESLALFFRLRFNYRPGDDLFVVFNQTSAIGSRLDGTDRTVLIKFTRSFEF